jgi:hypothetical protein
VLNNRTDLLFDLNWLLGASGLRVQRGAPVAGRSSWLVELGADEDRTVAWRRLQGFAPGADRYVLNVDVERPAVLRLDARRSGHSLRVAEMTEVVFDVQISDEVFSS